MRGKLDTKNKEVNRRRNIPAYAGKTESSRLKASLITEHPRVCGENIRKNDSDQP